LLQQKAEKKILLWLGYIKQALIEYLRDGEAQ
jgi:hypothetical protein